MNDKFTLIDVLLHRAETKPEKASYHFYDSKGKLEETLHSNTLAKRVLKGANQLLKYIQPGDRVAIVLPPGNGYITAFYATLTARGIAVPCYPPFSSSLAQQFKNIIEDCKPKVIITDSTILNGLRKVKTAAFLKNVPIIKYLLKDASDMYDRGVMEYFSKLTIVTMDELLSGSDVSQGLNLPSLEDIAFLQYTSGSTGKPKGVIIKHKNLVTNILQIKHKMLPTPTQMVVSWLPPYHDMGLIGGLLVPLYTLGESSFISPATFLLNPYIWLKLISDLKSEISGGPNFGYDLCVKKVTQEQLATLDLSSWQVAFNGADYIHPGTLQRFHDKFESAGFHIDRFYPCYGMAEATLFLTGKGAWDSLHIPVKTKDFTNIKRVSCGPPHPDIEIAIVHPETLKKMPDGEIGEVWVKGPNLSEGYYEKQELSEQAFKAYIPETGEGPYLRTGDWGLMEEGEVYITGRMKDILIYRGRNYFPQDIEACYQDLHPNIRKGCGIIFQADVTEEDRIVLLQEVTETDNLEELAEMIQAEVMEVFSLTISEFLFIKPKTIPKTTSGKIKRIHCKELYITNQLEIYQKIKG